VTSAAVFGTVEGPQQSKWQGDTRPYSLDPDEVRHVEGWNSRAIEPAKEGVAS